MRPVPRINHGAKDPVLNEENSVEAMMERLDRAAELLDLEPGIDASLRHPEKQIITSIPVMMDTGEVEVFHDCSTLGGNSGSAVVELDSGRVAGIHFKGGLRRNYAIAAPRVRERLDAVA